MTLQELLQQKAQLAASKTTLPIENKLSLADRLALKNAPSETLNTPLKNEIDTNIRDIPKNTLVDVKPTPLGISAGNKPTFAQLIQNKADKNSTLPNPSTLLSFAKKLASPAASIIAIDTTNSEAGIHQPVSTTSSSTDTISSSSTPYSISNNTNSSNNIDNESELTPYDFKIPLEGKEAKQLEVEFNAPIPTSLSNISSLRSRLEERLQAKVLDIPNARVNEHIKEKLALSLLERIALKKQIENKIIEAVQQEIIEVTESEITRDKIEETIKENIISLVETTAVAINVNHQAIIESDGKVHSKYTNEATFNLDIHLNEKQQAGVDFIPQGNSFVFLGAAGTGKTTSERGMMHAILKSSKLKECSFKVSGDIRINAPSVAVVAYTRRAAANSAKAILKDPYLRESLPNNIMTIHALLEFVPEEYWDAVENKMRFRFAPTRNRENPLTITHLIIEEATLVGLDLWEQLYEALPYDVQIVFVGDINQLPPVFGPSILNYALTQIPVIELSQVYRQAEGSPIIDNAHRILKGEFLKEGITDQGRLTIISGKNNTTVGQAKTAMALGKLFEQYYEMGIYNPDEDMILSPWNKHELGTDSLNKYISDFIGRKSNALVYEIIVGFQKQYLAINDKVMYNKQDAIIVGIEPNPAYIGLSPQIPSTDLSRWGFLRHSANSTADLLDEENLSDDEDYIEEVTGDYSNFSLEQLEETATERKMQSSHRVTLAFETGHTLTLSAAGELDPKGFSLGYAMTVHKSQGSEWTRVFCVFHKEHAVSLSREMLYTAITRAREEVYLIAKPATLEKAVTTQRVKGNTLKDKIEYFNSGIQQNEAVKVTKPSLANR